MQRAKSTRLSIEHMATNMYNERVNEDAKRGRSEIYNTNPDAQVLYFKGINDTILCIEEWIHMGLQTNTLAMFLEALQKQTEDIA